MLLGKGSRERLHLNSWYPMSWHGIRLKGFYRGTAETDASLARTWDRHPRMTTSRDIMAIADTRREENYILGNM